MKKSPNDKSDAREPNSTKRTEHSDGGTSRPETPELEGRTPLPEEVTGRASGTDDDLVVLFDEKNSEQLADGFRGGSEDEPLADDEGSNTERRS